MNTNIRPVPYGGEAAINPFAKPEALPRRESNAGLPPAAAARDAAVRVKRKQNRSRTHRKESSSSESIGTPEEESDSDERTKRKRKNRPKVHTPYHHVF